MSNTRAYHEIAEAVKALKEEKVIHSLHIEHDVTGMSMSMFECRPNSCEAVLRAVKKAAEEHVELDTHISVVVRESPVLSRTILFITDGNTRSFSVAGK